MKEPLRILSFILLAVSCAHAEKLLSPWDSAKINATNATYACSAPPKFAKTLAVEGYYTDSHYSVIDPAKKAAYEKADEELVHLGQFAGLAADAYLNKGSRAAAACVYALLDAAAEADAWTAEMPNGPGVYDQNWMLSGTAISYLKVRNSGAGTPAQDAEIQKWFEKLAQRVGVYFERSRAHPDSDAYNNHMYWAGLAIAADGIACNDQEAFLWGMVAYRQGVDAIQPDGSLTAEMNRAGRALHYQLYALAPLIMLAELGEANGIDMYGVDHGAIHRLAKFDAAAIEDPSFIVKRTGVQQDVSQPLSGQEIGWAVPYVKRFPDAQLSAMIEKAPWVRFWQWGGAPPEPEVPRPAPSGTRAAFESALQRRVNDAIAALFTDPSHSAAFLGAWCGQGDPAIHASIIDRGTYLVLTNENGDTSTGRTQGKSSVVAPGWDNVIGTLTPDGSQIDWSNGTFWERYDAASAGAGTQPLKLSGTWFAEGDRSNTCSIRQHDGNIQIACKRAGKATGKIDGGAHLTTHWSGQTIAAIVTADGNHINWDNQTYWTRSSVSKSSNQ
jgi:poly(beta-D-mannuronate) lyase